MHINHSPLLASPSTKVADELTRASRLLAVHVVLQLTRSEGTESVGWQCWEDEQQATTPTKPTLKALHPLLEE